MLLHYNACMVLYTIKSLDTSSELFAVHSLHLIMKKKI